MKQVQITLREKKTGKVLSYSCHHMMADASSYYLSGVKGLTDYGQVMIFSKAEWEKI